MFGNSILKMTIFQRLLIGISVMLLLNAIIAFVSLFSINKLEDTSKTILSESKNLDNLHNIKLSFNELLMPANDYLIHGNKVEISNFKKLDSIIRYQLENCKKIDTNSLSDHFLEELENYIKEIESYSQTIFNLKNPVGNTEGAVMMEFMDNITFNAIKRIDILLTESTSDLQTYININQATNIRASRIIIIVLLSITFFLFFGGYYYYVKEITKPIENLSKTAKKITLGDLFSRADVSTKASNEIENFTNLFNNMVGVLSEKTVSRDYFNSVISRIKDILIITNPDGKILIVNKVATDILGYKEEEIIGKNIKLILTRKNETLNLKDEKVKNIYKTYYSKSNIAIPVSFSKSFIYDDKNKLSGILFLAFHSKEGKFTDKESIEASSENLRKIKLKGEIPLTNRELEIIKLIISDFTSQEIADKLFISIRTVETHRKHIMEKLQTKSVISLVHYAIQNGLI